MFLNQNGVANKTSDGKPNELLFYSCMWIIIPNLLIFKVTDEWREKTRSCRRFLQKFRTMFSWAGKGRCFIAQTKKPQPPEVKTINIIVKLLDPVKFSVQKRNMDKMFNDLRISGLLNDIIGSNVKGAVRRYKELKE